MIYTLLELLANSSGSGTNLVITKLRQLRIANAIAKPNVAMIVNTYLAWKIA